MKRLLLVAHVSFLASTSAAAQGPISARLTTGRDVIQFFVTPDGQRAVYRADADRDQVFELYGVTTSGAGTPVKLHPALPSGRTVFGCKLDPTGSRVVYHANPNERGKLELFSVPVDASLPPVRLSGTGWGVVTGGIQTLTLFGEPLYEITPDGSRVAFVAGIEVSSAHCDLYSVPLDGSQPMVKLNPNFGLIGNLGVSIVSHIRTSPNGSRVVYEADQDVANDLIELYSVPIDGSAPCVKLSGTLVAGGNVVTDAFAITADSNRVVYLADQDTDGVNELYSAPLDGSASAVKLSGALASGGEVFRDFALNADGSRAVYRADQDTDGAVQLYGVPVDGSGPPVLLGGDGTSGRTVMHFALSPDGSHVAYCADQDSPRVFELYCAPVDGSGPALDLGGAFPANADVFPALRFTPDGGSIFFLSDAQANQRFDLFVVPADASSAPLRLNAAATDADVRAFQLTPDGTRVVLLSDVEDDEVPNLYQVAIGGGPNEKLCPSLPFGREVLSRFEVRNDVTFYLSDRATDGVFELFRSEPPSLRSHSHSTTAPTPTRSVTRGL